MIKIMGLSDSSCKLNGIWVEQESPGQSRDFITEIQEIIIDRRLEKYIKWRGKDK